MGSRDNNQAIQSKKEKERPQRYYVTLMHVLEGGFLTIDLGCLLVR